MADDKGEGPILPIPQVPKHWFFGNLPDIDPTFFARSYWQLANLYGPIFQLDLGGHSQVVISSYELLKDVMDDDRFEKKLSPQILELRPLIKDGLFTAGNAEPNWAKAHRILMPVFGPIGVKKMFSQQMDIASQMILRWDRFGPENEILCSDDFTRLAFDTIGLCAFNYRFNEFYSDGVHPFAQQMADALTEASIRANSSRLETALRIQADWKFKADIKAQHKLCDEIVADRIKNPKPEVNDLLNIMLNQEDPVTGEKLDRENIRHQMNTFLIAGHETTSGTLAFLFYHLLKNPRTYHKAQQEVDEVVGTNPLNVDHLPKLKYVNACINETLRVTGPITVNTRHAKTTQIIGGEHGRYEVKPEQWIACNLNTIHHDPYVYGEDAYEFKPERMLHMENVPDGAWKPFGVGMRACIGRTFAEQEMMINVALILQRFQVEMADPGYKLEFLATMTIKPKNFKIRVRRRPGRSINVGLGEGGEEHVSIKHSHDNKATQKSLLIIYGSNAGTCQAYAEELASRADSYGYQAEVKTMDAAVEHLPTDRPVAIITPSYEGKPADNAKKFVAWLEHHENGDSLKGVKYFVFGVGNQEWSQTFHKVPKLVDYLMEKLGAQRLLDIGTVDVQEDTMGPFEDWCDKVKDLLGESSRSEVKGIRATISKATTAKTLAGFNDATAIVKKNIVIADKGVGPMKMHMEVELPENVTYESGDYLAVLPFNHRDDIRRVLHEFKLNPDDSIHITETRKEFLKAASALSVYDLLAARVELATPVTQKQLKALAEAATDSKEKEDILNMSEDRWSEVLKRRFSILDVLEDHPSCQIDFTVYLDMLRPMTARQYSISSSMIEHKLNKQQATATVTYDVHETEAWSGNGRTFHGVASSYMAELKPGTELRCTVRPTNAGFHLPKDVTTPVIMICSGTGLAPMRGFIEERAALQKARGTKLGPALLYYGCRDIEKDFIYKGQLEEWEKQGVVSLRPCFSKHGSETDHWKYTSDRIYAEKDECGQLFKDGGKIFICGSASKLAKSTSETCLKIHMENHPDCSREEAEKWLDEIKEDRYVSDVFG